MSRKIGSHVTNEERCQIHAYLKSGMSKRATARMLGISHTALIQELFRNKGKRGYRFKQAQILSERRRSAASRRPHKLNMEVIAAIKEVLQESQASPVQIAGRLTQIGLAHISHTTIYRYIWHDRRTGGKLYKQLRRRAKPYNRKKGKLSYRGAIPDRVDIDKRPEIVEEKVRFGDFEVDTIIGSQHKGALVTIVDRASKYVFIRLIPRTTAKIVGKAIVDALDPFAKQGLVQTITADNGKEFSSHRKISEALNAQFYFAKPYHSWERGLNEHTNGLIRQYFPKGTKFTTISKEMVKEVERILNNRPRKILGFRTPREALAAMTQ